MESLCPSCRGSGGISAPCQKCGGTGVIDGTSRGDPAPEPGPAKSSKAKQFLGGAVGLLIFCGYLAFRLGLFSSGDRGHLKDIITEQLHIPVERVEITGDNTAVGTLASGEKLAIIYKRTGK